MCLLFDSIWGCVSCEELFLGVCRVGSCFGCSCPCGELFWVCVVWGVVFGCVLCGELFWGVCRALVGSLMRHCEESCKLATSMGGVLLFDMPQ